MKTREEAVKLINEMLRSDYKCPKEKGYTHIGRMEFRELMDFVYEGKPLSEDEKTPGSPFATW